MSNNVEPLVSVYIPAYKAADTLEKAVDSALTQIEDIEVIIVEDCSPDNTYEVAQKLAAKDQRVKLFRMEKNSGAPAAMNYAFKQARGKWLALLDSDDWYEEGRIKAMLALAENSNVQMVADNQYFFDKKADLVVGTAFKNEGRNRLVDIDVFLEHSNATKAFDYGMLKPMFLTSFIREHAIEYYLPTYIGYDYCILLCFFAEGGKAILTDTPYYNYVQPFGSISGQAQQEGRKHYNHEMQKDTNRHFINVLDNKLSKTQIAQLLRREREIDAMVCFYELRDGVRAKKIKPILRVMLKARKEFWVMMTKRIFSYTRRHMLGLPEVMVND